MKQELDNELCTKYPKLFAERNLPMTETCMCWGFECGDGWYNIIKALCANIQWHIDQTREQNVRARLYNRALRQAIHANSIEPLLTKYKNPPPWAIEEATEALAKRNSRAVPNKVPQVVVTQVKEKFGTLRFYYNGGDDQVFGMVRLAESMSAVTCEVCGCPGSTGGKGWLTTLCDPCRSKKGNK